MTTRGRGAVAAGQRGQTARASFRGEFLSGCDRDEASERAQAGQSLALELTNALARQVELVADRLERPRLAVEPEAQFEDPPLALRKRLESPPDALPAERFLGLVERIGGLAVGEQIAQLALVVGADRLVQRDRRVRGAERLVDVLHRQARRLCELLFRGLATKLDLEPARGTRQLLLALDDVDGDANRARVVRDGALHGLANPPGRIGRELVAAAPVELFDGAVQAERALLNQVEERDAEAPIALGDGDDEAKIRLDHVPLRCGVAALDPLREHDLLGGGEQLVAADVGEEELQAVGGAGNRDRRGLDLGRRIGRLLRFVLRRLGRRCGRRWRGRLADLEPGPLELARQLLDLLVVELQLGGKSLELGGIDEAALLRTLDDGADLFRLEQLVQLVLRQGSLSPFVASSVPASSPYLRREALRLPPSPAGSLPPPVPVARTRRR